jgi:hypothetical protein
MPKTFINITNYVKSITITSHITRLVLYTFLFLSFVIHLILLKLKISFAI